MYQVIFTNGEQMTITSAKAEKIELLKRQGMLNRGQRDWLHSVQEIRKLRDEPVHKTLCLTKDIICNCEKCT